jgi:hypothetical protein
MIQEFRRARRRKALDTILVTDTMTERVLGRVGNLSETGMLLIASQPLVEDALYQIRFTLSDEVAEERAIDVGAHLLWLEHANAPGRAWAGFRFIAKTDADAERLRAWIDAPGSQYE